MHKRTTAQERPPGGSGDRYRPSCFDSNVDDIVLIRTAVFELRRRKRNDIRDRQLIARPVKQELVRAGVVVDSLPLRAHDPEIHIALRSAFTTSLRAIYDHFRDVDLDGVPEGYQVMNGREAVKVTMKIDE